jgi:hypothetical protein
MIRVWRFDYLIFRNYRGFVNVIIPDATALSRFPMFGEISIVDCSVFRDLASATCPLQNFGARLRGRIQVLRLVQLTLGPKPSTYCNRHRSEVTNCSAS